jgi:hypothetical protein
MTRYIKTDILFPMSLVLLTIFAFLFDQPKTIFDGFCAILTSPSVLITDYLRVGGLGATLFNVSTILLMNYILIKALKLNMTGPIFAGLLTIAGFAFFGKNVLNITPIYLGIYLNSRFQKVPFKSLIIVLLFATGIAPIVSYLMFGSGWAFWIGIPAGIAVGILSGFLLPIMSVHMLRFHKGYNLYNIGFTMGILSLLYSAILRGVFKLDLFTFDSSTSEVYHVELLVMTTVFSLLFIILGLLRDPKAFKKYPLILKSSGRLVSDFMRDGGAEMAMINVGIMGLISILFTVLLSIPLNGPVISGILTVMGFAAFGKHPKNSIPVMLGASLWLLITRYTGHQVSIGLAIGVLFVTAVAPIAGRHGFIFGVIAGFIHVLLTPLTYPFQGGFDLYNNGFAAGFVAAILIPIFDFLRKDKVQEDL